MISLLLALGCTSSLQEASEAEAPIAVVVEIEGGSYAMRLPKSARGRCTLEEPAASVSDLIAQACSCPLSPGELPTEPSYNIRLVGCVRYAGGLQVGPRTEARAQALSNGEPKRWRTPHGDLTLIAFDRRERFGDGGEFGWEGVLKLKGGALLDVACRNHEGCLGFLATLQPAASDHARPQAPTRAL